MLRMGVGSGQGADSAAAGRCAARQALERLGPGKPDLVLVFSSIHFDLPEALKGIREVTGDAPLLGCSTAGEIGTGGGATGKHSGGGVRDARSEAGDRHGPRP